MSEWQKTRRNFLKAAAGLTSGTALVQPPSWAQTEAVAAPRSVAAFPKIDPQLMITPDQAFAWNAFKAEGGPTYAGSVGWKRFTDFLVTKMTEFGAVDLDSVEIPYDHYIVDDWPDRRTHLADSGKAVGRLVSDGTPVPVVASYGMPSGFTPPEGITAPMLYYDPAHPPSAGEIAGKILVFKTAPYPAAPYSEAFFDNFTPTDYEWRSPGEWPPLFVPPPASVKSSYHCRWVFSQLNGFAAIGIRGGALDWSSSTTFHPTPPLGSHNAASTRLTARLVSARNTRTVRRSRSIASTAQKCSPMGRPARPRP
jgi:hypothetical protein